MVLQAVTLSLLKYNEFPVLLTFRVSQLYVSRTHIEFLGQYMLQGQQLPTYYNPHLLI